MTNSKKAKRFQFWINVVLILITLSIVLPFVLVFISSLTDENTLIRNGYSFFPEKFSFYAYSYIIRQGEKILRAYGITVFVTIVGTAANIAMSALLAYPLSVKKLPYRRAITFFVFFTMLFNGGLVPTYILMNQTLHLKNTYLALIIPLLVNVWYLIMLRTFMSDIPNEIIESARIDGAGNWMIYSRFVLPLSKPALATVGLLTLLDYWNSWQPAMLYIDKKEMYPLQYMLQVMLRNIIEILKEMQNNVSLGSANIPTESTRMAMCLLAVGPMLFVFPFFQKYFTQGLTVGAVKG